MIVECGVPLAHSTTHDIYNQAPFSSDAELQLLRFM